MAVNGAIPPDAFRVLITGFGPYFRFPINPSWLAARPLNDTIIEFKPAIDPNLFEEDTVTDEMRKPKAVHITAFEIPVVYESVLATVPDLHKRPPVLPSVDGQVLPPPPEDQYDFIFHLGVAGRGHLRLERVAHKYGYHMKDANNRPAPIVRTPARVFSRIPGEPLDASDQFNNDDDTDGISLDNAGVMRGFGSEYEHGPLEITTDIDVTGLIHELRHQHLEHIYSSMDAGHHLADFIYYCSLAEAKRHALANPYEKRRLTQVLFMHVPPVGQPLSTQEVTDAISKIIVAVCQDIQRLDWIIQMEEREKDAKTS